jgi:hypothetical protein
MYSRMNNLLAGIFVFGVGIYIFVDDLLNSGTNFTFLGLLLISVAIQCFVLSYFGDDFRKPDERMKLIQQKGALYTYYIFLSYCLLLFILISMSIVNISALNLIMLFVALIIATAFLTMFILSFFY